MSCFFALVNFMMISPVDESSRGAHSVSDNQQSSKTTTIDFFTGGSFLFCRAIIPPEKLEMQKQVRKQ